MTEKEKVVRECLEIIAAEIERYRELSYLVYPFEAVSALEKAAASIRERFGIDTPGEKG